MSADAHSWTLRVTSEPSKGTKVYARRLVFEVGAPVSFDAEYPQVTGLEYLLGAAGAEIAGGLRHLARKRRVEVNDVEVLVQAELANPLVYLRVVDQQAGDPAIARIGLKVYISSFEDEPVVRRLWDELLTILPVLNTLKKAVRIDIAYQQVF